MVVLSVILFTMALTYLIQRYLVKRFPKTMASWGVSRKEMFIALLIPGINLLFTLANVILFSTSDCDERPEQKRWDAFLQAFYGKQK